MDFRLLFFELSIAIYKFMPSLLLFLFILLNFCWIRRVREYGNIRWTLRRSRREVCRVVLRFITVMALLPGFIAIFRVIRFGIRMLFGSTFGV